MKKLGKALKLPQYAIVIGVIAGFLRGLVVPMLAAASSFLYLQLALAFVFGLILARKQKSPFASVLFGALFGISLYAADGFVSAVFSKIGVIPYASLPFSPAYFTLFWFGIMLTLAVHALASLAGHLTGKLLDESKQA